MATDSPLRRAFDDVSDLTVGAEEELLLLDPATLAPVPASEWVLAELAAPAGALRPELWSAQIELVSEVRDAPHIVVADLAAARGRLVELLAGRVRIAGLGTHPLAWPAPTFHLGDRYAEIVRRHALGARVGALASGLHVHVAVAGAERALAVYNAMRGYAPLFTALAANAPFIAGEDSGLASVRPMLADALPRQGVGPHLPSWSALEDLVDWGRRTGAIADPARLWWEVRLNLRLGTVELRAPDTQASLDDTHALVVLAHALVADLCDRLDSGERLRNVDTLHIEENRWRAMRFGIEAELVDYRRDRPVPAREAVAELVEQVGRHASAAGLDHVSALAARNEPCEQRRLARRRGVGAIVARAADRTEAAASMDETAAGYTGGTWTTVPSSRRTPTGR